MLYVYLVMTNNATDKNDIRQRLHDLRAVRFDLEAICSLLKTGYRFDEPDKIEGVCQQLKKGLATLDREIAHLEVKKD
jgi:hypothetical protein